MKPRTGSALLLGGAVVLGAVAFGSRTLGVVGIGLVLAGAAARGWAALVRSRVSAVVTVVPSPATEGDDVRVEIETRRASRVPVGSVAVHAQLGRLGVVECRLRGHGRSATGELSLGRLPRGLFPVTETALELGDPLGLERVSISLDTRTAVVVHPRLVELNALFSDGGRIDGEGRRLLLRRHAGFDFHSVREYEQGESLRRIHWPTTARRGQLMVKELEESPHDAVAVVLDCDPAGAAGSPPDSSFDAAVRAAGSLVRAHVARGRRTALVVTAQDASVLSVGSLSGDFGAILGMLAAVEPDAAHPLDRMLNGATGPAAQAGELVVVTPVLSQRAAERLLDAAARRLVAVVWIDASSWAGRPTRVLPGALQLTAAGVPVAAIRRGDDLAAALGSTLREARVG
jgi:uncharacterized protein (DUF58 family)